MLLIASAFLKEAAPFIHHLCLKKEEPQSSLCPEKPVYTNEKITLIITGMGKKAMEKALISSMEKRAFSFYLNIGYAGHPLHLPGKAFFAQKISQENASSFYPHIFPFMQRLSSSDLISVDKMEKKFSKDALYDMEGYAFFSTLIEKRIPLEAIASFKVVSDGPNHPFQKTSLWMEKAASELIPLVERLAEKTQRIGDAPDFLIYLPKSLHFTTYQKERAKKLFHLAQSLGEEKVFTKVTKTNAQAFLETVEHMIEQKALDYA